MNKCGIIKGLNGHIEFYADDEKYSFGMPLAFAVHTNDNRLLLQLDSFAIFSLYQLLEEHVMGVKLGTTKSTIVTDGISKENES